MSFSVLAVSPGCTVSYQWYGPQGLIAGATGTNYTINPVSIGNAGSYYAVASVIGSSRQSSNATLTVTFPNLTPYQLPGWSDKIVVTKTLGATTDDNPLTTTNALYVDWAVVNIGTGPTATTFANELYLDGVLQATWNVNPPMPAGNNFNAHVTGYAIGMLSAGTHTLRIKIDSANTAVESDETDNEYTKTINVLAPPVIIQQPQSQTVPVGSNATFSVTATGSAPLSYQWRFNGTNISAATASAYTITNVQPSQAGSYSVLVSNVLGSAISSNALLTVLLAVTSTSDSGVGSLRQAIADAAPGNVIAFLVTGIITLTSGELVIDKDLTISGPGATNLTVSGNNTSRVFSSHCISLSISGLMIADGNVSSIGGNGGGIQSLGGALLLSDCVVSNCVANVGGGIYCDEASVCGFQLDLTRSRITRNTASVGGGVFAWGRFSASDTTICSNTGEGVRTVIFVAGLTNCTISGNAGDGLYWGTAAAPGYEVNLSSCTICSNSGVGIRNDSWTWGTVTVRNTIVSGNSGGSGPDCSGGLNSGDFNLIQNTNACTITGVTTHNIYNQDPKLGPLADNGGPTPTHALLPGSPAIDQGSSAGLTTDQRGYPRPVNQPGIANVADGSDIGAYETGAVTSIRLSSAGFTTNGFQFTLTGPVGIYVIQASTNLASWVPLATNSTPTGLWDYTDPGATGVGRRFYRALLQ